MGRFAFLFTCLVLVGAYSPVNGQSSEQKPVFAQSSEYKYALNPAANLLDKRFELVSLYKNYVGEFSAVRTMFLAGGTRLKENHKLWFELYANQEGPYFSKNRFYLGYAPEIQLNPEWLLSLGATFGAIQYQFKPSSGGAGGSEINIDGSVGGVLKNKVIAFGLSYQQFTNSTIAPIDGEYVADAYADFFVQYDQKWNYKLRSQFLCRAHNFGGKSHAELYWDNYLYEWVRFGLNFNTEKELAFKGGVALTPRNESQVDFNFAYRLLFDNVLNSSIVELGFAFYANRKK